MHANFSSYNTQTETITSKANQTLDPILVITSFVLWDVEQTTKSVYPSTDDTYNKGKDFFFH